MINPFLGQFKIKLDSLKHDVIYDCRDSAHHQKTFSVMNALGILILASLKIYTTDMAINIQKSSSLFSEISC